MASINPGSECQQARNFATCWQAHTSLYTSGLVSAEAGSSDMSLPLCFLVVLLHKALLYMAAPTISFAGPVRTAARNMCSLW